MRQFSDCVSFLMLQHDASFQLVSAFRQYENSSLSSIIGCHKYNNVIRQTTHQIKYGSHLKSSQMRRCQNRKTDITTPRYIYDWQIYKQDIEKKSETINYCYLVKPYKNNNIHSRIFKSTHKKTLRRNIRQK